MKGINEGCLGTLELDLNHRQAIDEKSNIQSTVLVQRIYFFSLDLIDNFVARLTSCDIVSPDNWQTDGA